MSTLNEIPVSIYRERTEISALIEQFEALSAQDETIQDNGLTASWFNLMSNEWASILRDAALRAALLDNAILITDAEGHVRAGSFAFRYLNSGVLDLDNEALSEFVELLNQASSTQKIKWPLGYFFLMGSFRKVVVKRANQDGVLAYLYRLRTPFYRPIDRERLRLLDQLTSDIALHQTLIEYGAPQQRPAYLRVLWQEIGQLFFELELR